MCGVICGVAFLCVLCYDVVYHMWYVMLFFAMCGVVICGVGDLCVVLFVVLLTCVCCAMMWFTTCGVVC